MGTENTGFHRGFKQRVQEIKGFGFKKHLWDFLEFFYAPRGRDSSYFGLFSIIGVVWLSFNALRGCLALFALRSCLEK